MLRILRKLSTNAKPKVKVITNANVLQELSEEKYKPKKHPGIDSLKSIHLPESLERAAYNILKDEPIKTLVKNAAVLNEHLKSKVAPMEPDQIKELKEKIYQRILTKEFKKQNVDDTDASSTTTDNQKFEQRIKDKTIFVLKKKVYNWSPLTFDAHTCLVYLIARFAPDYAALVRIFSEIKKRDSQFVPKAMFNFGSGLGTAIWAANLHWERKIFEYYNVDSSAFMNDLSLLLLKDGEGTKQPKINGLYYRQFLPATDVLYDIVVCSYTLMELPSLQARLDTALKLWNKTGKYLVIVDKGTNGGFRIINEIRDYILQVGKGDAHVFSPCPHDDACPRFLTNDDTPCNFEVQYYNFPFVSKIMEKELFSYVVLVKGSRSNQDEQWPRIVRSTCKRSKHAICRMCTKSAKLQEVIFTSSKHGKSTYHCARSSKWGDRLPIDITDNNEEESGEKQEA